MPKSAEVGSHRAVQCGSDGELCVGGRGAHGVDDGSTACSQGEPCSAHSAVASGPPLACQCTVQQALRRVCEARTHHTAAPVGDPGSNSVTGVCLAMTQTSLHVTPTLLVWQSQGDSLALWFMTSGLTFTMEQVCRYLLACSIVQPNETRVVHFNVPGAEQRVSIDCSSSPGCNTLPSPHLACSRSQRPSCRR